MKSTQILAACAILAVASALTTPSPVEQVPLGDDSQVSQDLFWIEYMKHGVMIQEEAIEDRKWELRREGTHFMDITNHQDLGIARRARIAADGTGYTYPNKPYHLTDVLALTKKMTKKPMKKELETFSNTKKFRTRFYKSKSGAESAQWLLEQVGKTIEDSGANKHGASVKFFQHPWGQHSIIVRIPGKTRKTVIVGAHQDSINPWGPYWLSAPGADDDGSGTVTIHEALRTILKVDKFKHCEAENDLEFHWYSAEEGGLLGSQAVFSSYERDRREVVAMLQQDMTGYTKGTKKPGDREVAGLIVDYVDPKLTDFVKQAIDQYGDMDWVETKCGYACSDHASANKAGYPSAFVIESEFKDSNPHIHSTDDTTKELNFDHMLRHAKMTLGFAYELAEWNFNVTESGW